MFSISYIAAMVVAVLVTAGIMPAVIRLAGRMGVVDEPGGRRIHNGRIPRLGGIGIYLGVTAGIGAGTLFEGRAGSLSDPSEYRWVGIGIGITLIFVVGLADDILQLRPRTKFLFQILAAFIAIYSGFIVKTVTVPFVGVVELGIFALPATLFWILLIINAFNLIDGLDGLAGGVALIASATVATVAFATDRFGVVLTALAVVGALIGFLKYNFTPARIFMGDGGSQFLGYTIAVIAIRGSQKSAAAVAIMLPLLVMGLPLLDLGTTVLRRLKRSMQKGGIRAANPLKIWRSIAAADREHLHHNLLDLGMSPKLAVIALYCITGLFALAGYLIVAFNSNLLGAIVLVLSIGSVFLIKFLIAGTSYKVRAEESPERTEG